MSTDKKPMDAMPEQSGKTLKKTAFFTRDLDTLRIENKYAKDLLIKVRLQDSPDETLLLPKNKNLEFTIGSYDDKPVVLLYDRIVQQLDFNRGGASDDMNMPNTKYNQTCTITYTSNFRSKSTMVDLQARKDGTQHIAEYTSPTVDQDGIDGGAAAKITFSFHDDTLTARILPMSGVTADAGLGLS